MTSVDYVVFFKLHSALHVLKIRWGVISCGFEPTFGTMVSSKLSIAGSLHETLLSFILFSRLPLRGEVNSGSLTTITAAINPILFDLVANNPFRSVEQLRGAFAIATRCLERVLNNVALVGGHCGVQ